MCSSLLPAHLFVVTVLDAALKATKGVPDFSEAKLWQVLPICLLKLKAQHGSRLENI